MRNRRTNRASALARRDALAAAVRARPHASTAELAKATGLNPKTAYGDLLGLLQLGQIERIDPGTEPGTGRYVCWIPAGPPPLTDDELEELIG